MSTVYTLVVRKKDEMKYKPLQPGDGVPRLPTKYNKRVDLLAPLFKKRREYEVFGATRRQWLALAHELEQVNAVHTAKWCRKVR